MAATLAPMRETPETQPCAEDDGVRWLALLLLQAMVLIANGIRRRYGLSQGVRCHRCGHQQ